MDKNSLRKYFKNLRKELLTLKISQSLVNKLINLKEYQTSKNIMLFYPLDNEINLLEILSDTTKNFYLPKIEGDEIVCCPYKIGDELKISKFNTKEPITNCVDKNILDLIIVPALCCDKNNYRLGYGKGYYDRFLKGFDGYTITCLPKEFIIDTINPDKYDIPIKLVITD